MTVTEFFNSLESGATWSAGVAFKRSNPLPIDRYSVFKTEADALAYAKTNAVAYPGQVVATVSETEAVVYVIAAVGTTGKIVKLAASSTASDISELVAALTTRVANLEKKVGTEDFSSIFPTGTEDAKKTLTNAVLTLKSAIDANAANITKHKTKINGKVDSVASADKSVVVTTTTGTADADGFAAKNVAVKANISTKAGNILKLATDSGKEGLYVEAPAQTDYTVSLSTATTPTAGMLKTYVIKQKGAEVGKIDIPKDFLVKSGSVKAATEANKPYTGAKVGDKYIELVINSKDSTTSTGDTALYIPVKDLVDVYTGGSTATVTVAVGDDNKITASVIDKSIITAKLADSAVTAEKLALNAVETAKIKDKAVTKAKLADDVQTSLGKADKSVSGVTLTSGTNNGTVKLTVTKADGTSTPTDNIAVKGLAGAAYKAVDTSMSTTAAITSTNLPTAKAVADYVTAMIADATAIYRYDESGAIT